MTLTQLRARAAAGTTAARAISQNSAILTSNQSFSFMTNNIVRTNQLISSGIAGSLQQRQFSTTNDDPTTVEPPKKRRGRPPKAAATSETAVEAATPKPKTTRKRKAKAEVQQEKMYVLKFNSPILPYAKFPLTHNKYIQEFIKMYEEDKLKIDKVIGVHFPQNNNSLAKDTVGIEVKVTKRDKVTLIESNNS
jgi:hypothetical protein